MVPNTSGATYPVAHVYGPPYHGGVLPTLNLVTYGCHSKATQLKAWGFALKQGVGGGSDSAYGKACPATPYRVGSQSIGTAGGGMEVSVATPVPTGFHNLTAAIDVNYTAILKESSGSTTDKCPLMHTTTHSGSYYDGSSWSYYPNFHGPIVLNSKTYYYYSTTHGASGSCSSYAQIALQVQVVAIASNGLAGYGLANDSLTSTVGAGTYSLSPSTFNLGAYVSTVNSTYWSCSNATLWNYGSWSNTSASCSGSNNTVTSSWNYHYSKIVPGTNSSMTFSDSDLLLMSWFGNYSASRTWDVMMFITCNTNAGTGYFPHGVAIATLNVGTAGNGITLKSVTVK